MILFIRNAYKQLLNYKLYIRIVLLPHSILCTIIQDHILFIIHCSAGSAIARVKV